MNPDPIQVTVDIRRQPEVTVTREAQSERSLLSTDPRLIEAIGVLHNQLLKKRPWERDEFALLGSCLYDYIFTGDARRAMTRWLSDVPASGLRLVLQFGPQSGELVKYPWEYLHIPADVLPSRKGFIAAREELVLSRHFRYQDGPASQQVVPPPAERLRILVGIASPIREELPRWDETDERGKNIVSMPDISAETAGLVETLRESGADVEVDAELTQTELTNLLGDRESDFRPHVVHLIAHGTFDDEVGGALALCRKDEKRMAAWTRDSDLADCFSHTPTVVFLHACSTAASATQIRGFRGVAMRLVERGVPAVVAMNFEIDAGSAMRFAIAFYAALEQGEAVDRAVQLGRREIGISRSGGSGNFSGRAFGCPVAFVQIPGAVIQPTVGGGGTAGTVSEPEPQPQRDTILYCPCTNRVMPNMVKCPSCKQSIQYCPQSSPDNTHGEHLWRPNDKVCPFCGYPDHDPHHAVPASGAKVPFVVAPSGVGTPAASPAANGAVASAPGAGSGQAGVVGDSWPRPAGHG